jgi:hypothetical protein
MELDQGEEMRLVKDPAPDAQNRLDAPALELVAAVPQHVPECRVRGANGPIIGERDEPARRGLEQRVDPKVDVGETIRHRPLRYSRITAIVSSG